MPYGLKDIELEKLSKVFAANERIERVVLYGSRAKGNYKPFSDVDITLEGAELTHTDLNRISLAIDDLLLPYQFDISIFHTLKNEALIDHIRRMGITIYEKKSEWKEYKLGELTIDGKGSYGIAAPAVDFNSDKYTYLRITDINDDGTLNKNGLKSVDDKNSHKYLLRQNDIVFARTGASVGRSYFYDERDGELVYAGFLIKYSIDPTKVNPKILKFYTHSQAYYDWIQTVDNGATRGNINAQTYASMPIILPERQEQDRIVSILSSLDDKIDLLHRENATLERMAETLFRQWFVVEAKEEWEEGKLGDICNYVTEKIDIGNVETGDYISTENMCPNKQGVVLASSVPENGKATKYRIDDVLLSNIRPYFKKIWLSDREGGCSADVLCIRGKNELYAFFSYYTIRQDEFFDYVMLGSKGCKMPRGDKSHIMNWPIIIPPKDELLKFNGIAKQGITKIRNNNKQIQILNQTRDGLLPRLMSGDVKIL